MSIMKNEADTEQEQLRQRLTESGVRPTRQRLMVLKELAREPNDATAQDLHRRLIKRGNKIGMATVYRALNSFAEAGAIDVLPNSSGESCYRLCTSGVHHHHLVCSQCHSVVELTDCRLDEWLSKVLRSEKFLPTGHTLEVVGLCVNCKA